jgi:SAM-dependent methyltransferase
MISYYQLKQKLTPGLRFNQEIYEETLTKMVDSTTIWLDAGCGRHVLPSWLEEGERGLVERARLVVGCDAEERSLRDHRTIHSLVVADLEHLPFKSGSVTLITGNMVVEHLQNPASVFAEFARVLAGAGHLVVHTPNAYSYFVAASRWLPRGLRLWLVRHLDGRNPNEVFVAHYRANTVRTLRKLMASVGLKEKSCRMLASDGVFGALPLLAALELLYIRLSLRPALRWLRVTILATYSQPGPAALEDSSTPRAATRRSR